MQRTDTVADAYVPSILAAAFQGPACIYEAYSKFDRHLRSFPSLEGLLEYVSSERQLGERHVGLAVHYPDTDGHVHTRKIPLNPAKCGGATWRECVEGWGLIHVQFTFLEGGRASARIAVNSEKRARGWAPTVSDLGDPSLWKWKLVESHARRLIRVLRKGAP